MPPTRFPIRLGPRSRPLLRVWGVRPETAWVELDGELVARFGAFTVRTPISNVVRWRIEGPWRWITAIGLRLSVRGRDVTFGGNHRGGVRIDFRDPVPFTFLRIPALYVTVADVEALADALAARGVPGEDARR
ncbi:MAG TPA: hypothetical protein VEY67_02770 [Candidatus Dormibacteraeota bacterium]|nr:hypothetical protein [Candidatus Dormibacteraeota bacterium]